MTLNLLFFTITISKRETTIEEEIHDQMVEKRYEESKEKAAQFIRY
ncbi:YrzI family small protein [Mesobacillus maritimus]|nr:YrzI family small protein [Mesobacillus maritimus]MCM3588848.1 YrzI family small protein [Mesobacillus maritimus]